VYANVVDSPVQGGVGLLLPSCECEGSGDYEGGGCICQEFILSTERWPY